MVFLFAVGGFVLLVALFFCLRIMRKGRKTLREDRARWRERFTQEEAQLTKEQAEIPLKEHLHIAVAAVRDLLRLENCAEAQVLPTKNGLTIHVATGARYTITLTSRTQTIHSLHKVLHSPNRWTFSWEGGEATFTRLEDLMQTLLLHLRGEYEETLKPTTSLQDEPHTQVTPPVAWEDDAARENDIHWTSQRR